MLQDWERDEYIDEETLDAALAASAAALGIAATVVRAGEVDDDEGPHRGIVVRSYDAGDAVCFEVEGPVVLRGTVPFSGYGFELDTADARGPGEALYLFAAHVATALGCRPEMPFGDDEESPFLDELRSSIDACACDYLDELGIEPGDIPISTEARPAPMGPLAIDGRRSSSGVVIDVRGAGTDVRITVGGAIGGLSDAQIAGFLASVHDSLIVDHVQQQRSFALGRSAPGEAPAFGGKTVLRVWVDGVCAREEILDARGPVREVLSRAAAEGMIDVVRYLSNGTPIFRAVGTELGEHETTVDAFERTPTWRWCPSSVDDVARVFREVTRR